MTVIPGSQNAREFVCLTPSTTVQDNAKYVSMHTSATDALRVYQIAYTWISVFADAIVSQKPT